MRLTDQCVCDGESPETIESEVQEFLDWYRSNFECHSPDYGVYKLFERVRAWTKRGKQQRPRELVELKLFANRYIDWLSRQRNQTFIQACETHQKATCGLWRAIKRLRIFAEYINADD